MQHLLIRNIRSINTHHHHHPNHYHKGEGGWAVDRPTQLIFSGISICCQHTSTTKDIAGQSARGWAKGATDNVQRFRMHFSGESLLPVERKSKN